MVGCVGKGVGNGVGMSVTGINVDVGTDVGETTVGMGVSVGRMTACFSQADNIASSITINKYFITN